MKYSKRVLSVLLALGMSLSFAACGSSSSASTATSSKTSSSTSVTTSSSASSVATSTSKDSADSITPVEIEFWHALPEAQGGTLIHDICEKFNETNKYGIKVKDVFCADFYDGIARDLQAAIAAGNYPGVAMVGYQYLNYFDENFPQITSINSIEKEFPDQKAWIDENFSDRTLQLAKTLNGNILGLPYCASQCLLYYNKDMFKQAGLDPDNPPTTVDEMYEDAMAITKATGEYGIYLGYPLDTWYNESMIRTNGGDYFTKNGDKYVAAFNSPKAAEVWTKIQKFYTDKTSVPMTFEEGMSAFIAGKFGMTLNTCARINMISTNAKFELGTAEFPVFKSGETLKSCVAGNMITVVAENSNKRRAAWEFVKYLFSVDNAAAMVMKTGYVPTVKDLGTRSSTLKEYLVTNKYIAPAIKSFNESAVNWSSWPGANGLQIAKMIIEMKDEINTNLADVQTTLDNTAEKVNAMLN